MSKRFYVDVDGRYVWSYQITIRNGEFIMDEKLEEWELRDLRIIINERVQAGLVDSLMAVVETMNMEPHQYQLDKTYMDVLGSKVLVRTELKAQLTDEQKVILELADPTSEHLARRILERPEELQDIT